MIYIDPPYNTGKDFVYKDNYKDNLSNYLEISNQVDGEGNKLNTNTESDGRYHSNWLNMLYPRLKLARNLLTEDGVVFISIDDNEVHNIIKLCDEVFGESNKLDRGSFVWINKGSTKGFNKIVKNHEYIIAYGKNSECVKSQYGLNFPDLLDDLEHYCFNKPNPGNPICTITFKAGCKIDGISEATFTKSVGDEVKLEIVNGEMTFKNGILLNDIDLKGAFPYRTQIETYFKNLGTNIPTIDYKGQEWLEIYFNSKGLPRYRKERNTKIISSIIDDSSIPNYGSDDIKQLFGIKEVFSFPKPKELIFHLLSYFVSGNDYVFDFFAGSCTTAHSVFEFNKRTKMKINFICIQLPEPTDENSESYKAGYKNIAEISKERIRRAGEKVKSELSTDLFSGNKNKLDIGFKAFKLDSSNIHSWDGSVENFETNLFNAQNNIKDDRTEEDVLYEILLKYGLDLTVPIQEKAVGKCKVYSIGAGVLFICLSDNITTDVAEAIGEWKNELEPATCRVLFKDNGFIDDVAKTNSVQILRQYGIEECNSI